VQNRVVWRIKRKNPLRGLTCRHVEEKKAYTNNIFCIYFTHLPRSPPWRDLHKILQDGSPCWLNQPCQILSQSVQGFWFCGGSNFWLTHSKKKSPLTQGLNYHSAWNIKRVRGCWVKQQKEKSAYHASISLTLCVNITSVLSTINVVTINTVMPTSSVTKAKLIKPNYQFTTCEIKHNPDNASKQSTCSLLLSCNWSGIKLYDDSL